MSAQLFIYLTCQLTSMNAYKPIHARSTLLSSSGHFQDVVLSCFPPKTRKISPNPSTVSS